ncbi:ACT domain-containing protein [Aliikangiella sp. IMCC44359]
MTGEKNLAKLLVNISPELKSDEFVFCTFESAHYVSVQI